VNLAGLASRANICRDVSSLAQIILPGKHTYYQYSVCLKSRHTEYWYYLLISPFVTALNNGHTVSLRNGKKHDTVLTWSKQCFLFLKHPYRNMLQTKVACLNKNYTYHILRDMPVRCEISRFYTHPQYDAEMHDLATHVCVSVCPSACNSARAVERNLIKLIGTFQF
jgi:hypothetical protein